MLWIDTDMGFDDMLAIMMVEQSGLNIAGVSLVFGNAPLSQVRANAAGAVALLDWSFPIYTGAEKSVLGAVETPAHVLGPTGIPTLGKPLPEGPELSNSPAFAALTGWLDGLAEPADILALGPLTNIAALALARPDLLQKIHRLTWMGGGVTRGNHTPSAEFNSFADPEAVAIVLTTGMPFRMIDLDLCRQVLVAPDDLIELRRLTTPKAEILADLLGAYVDIAISRGRPAMALYDPTAAAALIDPEAFTFAPAHLAMELGGTQTRGRTVVDQRPGITPNIEIGLSADGKRVLDLALTSILKAATS